MDEAPADPDLIGDVIMMERRNAGDGILPAGLARSGWALIVVGAMGFLAAATTSLHTSAPAALLIVVVGCAWWCFPIYLALSAILLVRGRRAGSRPTRSELVLTGLFAAGTIALLALWAGTA